MKDYIRNKGMPQETTIESALPKLMTRRVRGTQTETLPEFIQQAYRPNGTGNQRQFLKGILGKCSTPWLFEAHVSSLAL
jgi:hypothetical protein